MVIRRAGAVRRPLTGLLGIAAATGIAAFAAAVLSASPAGATLITSPGGGESFTIRPGDLFRVGYDFTIPGDSRAITVSWSDPSAVVDFTCPDGTPGSFTIAMPDYAVTVADGRWYPSGDQKSPLVYQGVVAHVPDYCGHGGAMHQRHIARFTADVTSEPSGVKINYRFHDADDNASGSWSSTNSVVAGPPTTPTSSPAVPPSTSSAPGSSTSSAPPASTSSASSTRTSSGAPTSTSSAPGTRTPSAPATSATATAPGGSGSATATGPNSTPPSSSDAGGYGSSASAPGSASGSPHPGPTTTPGAGGTRSGTPGVTAGHEVAGASAVAHPETLSATGVRLAALGLLGAVAAGAGAALLLLARRGRNAEHHR